MSLESKPVNVEDLRAAVTGSKAYARLAALFDEGSMREIDPLAVSEGKPAEVVAAFGKVEGMSVCAFSQNSKVAGGAISTASAAKMIKVYEYALKTGCPVVGVYDSTGARLRQGNEMLNAIGEMLALSNNLSGVVPQISVIAGTCVGTASLLAASADIIICAADAVFGFDTAGGNKKGAESAAEGVVHLVEKDDAAAMQKARLLVSMLPQNNLSAAAECEFGEPSAVAKAGAKAEELIAAVADDQSFVELSAGFGKCAVTGFATVEGQTVGVICYNEGEKALVGKEGSAKAARFVRFCDAFSIPVVSLVNVSGFASMREASMLAHAYAETTAPKITVVTGAAYGAAYIALAGAASGADLVYVSNAGGAYAWAKSLTGEKAWPQAVIAPLAPETAANVLYADKFKGVKDQKAARSAAVSEYKSTLASPFEAAKDGYIQDVIDPSMTRSAVVNALELLAGKRVQTNPKKHSNIQL